MLSTSACIPSSPLSNTNQDVKWKYGEGDKADNSKSSKFRKKTSSLFGFNRRSKESQEDDTNVRLSANMMIISGNNDGGKGGDNTGSAATISKEEDQLLV